MLGYVSVVFFLDNIRDGEDDHVLDNDGDTFQDLRNLAHFRYPEQRIRSITIFTENDDYDDITYKQGSLRAYIQTMNGPNGQGGGDAYVHIFLDTIGPNEECKVCGNVAKWMCSETGNLFCTRKCAKSAAKRADLAPK